MQLLLTQPAYDRVKDRLPGGLDLVLLQADGSVHRDGATAADGSVDPEAAWFSMDLFTGGPAGAFFGRLMQGSKGRWLQSFSAGIDSPAFKAVMHKGLRLTKSDAQAPAIAEYVMAHALSLLHPIAPHAKQQAAHEWKRIPYREVADTTWLMIGFGHIGTEIAQRLKPFGAKLIVARRRAGSDPLAERLIAQADIAGALPEADVIVLCCALTDETRDLADAAFFRALKPSALFINVGRGELVDEDALKAALDDGRLSHAVLDVFRTEPLPEGAWQWDHPKVRVTPHDSPVSSGLMRRGDAIFLDNLNRFIAGEPLRNEAQPHEVGL